jgi:hypothetical protein
LEPRPIRPGWGRTARSSTAPSEIPLLVFSRDRRGRLPRLQPAATEVPKPAVAASNAPAPAATGHSPGLLPIDQAVGYARYVYHDPEQSWHFCAAAANPESRLAQSRSGRARSGVPVALRDDRWPRPSREIRRSECVVVSSAVTPRTAQIGLFGYLFYDRSVRSAATSRARCRWCVVEGVPG